MDLIEQGKDGLKQVKLTLKEQFDNSVAVGPSTPVILRAKVSSYQSSFKQPFQVNLSIQTDDIEEGDFNQEIIQKALCISGHVNQFYDFGDGVATPLSSSNEKQQVDDNDQQYRPKQTLHPSLHHPVARGWSEPTLEGKRLMYPVFVRDQEDDKPVKGFEPNLQWGNKNNFQTLVEHLQSLHEIGLTSCMLFGVVLEKDEVGIHADSHNTPVIQALQIIRKVIPELFVSVDVCLCEYTSHGHCGLLKEQDLDGSQVIDNHATIQRLADVAVNYAKAGAHMVCPSDMMDGRVGTIKKALEQNGFHHVMIMSYTSKKASTMYAPFRLAVDSTFTGNRRRYQHPIGSTSHALRAFKRDIEEGADVFIVKPSLFYGDIISTFSQQERSATIAAYVVSGEYVMIKQYGESTGDLYSVVLESHLSLLRQGASVLITYFTPLILKMLQQNRAI